MEQNAYKDMLKFARLESVDLKGKLEKAVMGDIDVEKDLFDTDAFEEEDVKDKTDVDKAHGNTSDDKE